MKILVNGEEKEINPGTCVEDYLLGLDINIETVVVECDSVILQRDEYKNHVLKEGAVLELIRFIGGG